MVEHGPYGISWKLDSVQALRRATQVLDRIRAAQPEDYDRLIRVVRDIVPLRTAEKEDGTLGQWIKDNPRDDDPSTWGYGSDETPGMLKIDESLEGDRFIAVFAHQLGHACTVSEDLEARGRCLSDEWASELTADWYAGIRWGFRQEMESIWHSRDRLHHGAMPGEEFEEDGSRMWVDEDYRAHFVD